MPLGDAVCRLSGQLGGSCCPGWVGGAKVWRPAGKGRESCSSRVYWEAGLTGHSPATPASIFVLETNPAPPAPPAAGVAARLPAGSEEGPEALSVCTMAMEVSMVLFNPEVSERGSWASLTCLLCWTGLMMRATCGLGGGRALRAAAQPSAVCRACAFRRGSREGWCRARRPVQLLRRAGGCIAEGSLRRVAWRRQRALAAQSVPCRNACVPLLAAGGAQPAGAPRAAAPGGDAAGATGAQAGRGPGVGPRLAGPAWHC